MIKVKTLIPNYKNVEQSEGSRSYHVYLIHITLFLNGTSSRIYFLEKRYSDFLQLHNLLKRQYETPMFPPKRVRNSRVKVLEARRVELEQYLQVMTGLSPLPREVVKFLEIPSHPKEFLPNSWQGDRKGLCTSFTGDSSDNSGFPENFSNPAAAFFEDPFLDSDSNSNLSDSITRGVLDALYHS